MFAAVLVEMVATMMMIIDRTTQNGLSIRPISVIGSEMVSPTSCADAAVMTTPSPAKRSIVSGRPTICPMIWLLLRSGEAAEVRNVERQRRPEADHRGEAREEVGEQRCIRRAVAGSRQQLTDRGLRPGPAQQPGADEQQERRRAASSNLIDSEPRITTQTFATQKMKKPNTSPTPPSCAQSSEIADNSRCTAIPPNSVWMSVPYLGALTFALAYALLYSGLRTTSSSAAVVATLCEPVTAAVAAAVFLDERLGVWGIVGIALVVAAIAGTAREQHPTGAGPVADPDPGRPRVTR